MRKGVRMNFSYPCEGVLRHSDLIPAGRHAASGEPALMGLRPDFAMIHLFRRQQWAPIFNSAFDKSRIGIKQPTGADGNRTHQRLRNSPSTALKAAEPTRNPDAPLR